MKVFPLVRAKLSNEHIMTAVFIVLVLYQLPQWTENPLFLLKFLGVLLIGLLLDTILSTRRNKSIKCSVSASVTVGIIYALYPDVSFWVGLLGVVVALIFGKQIFGGTGKNILNPAMVGIVLIDFIFPNGNILFSNNYIIFIAMLLSIPFIIIRLHTSMGFMTGMIISMSLNNSLTLENVISTGVIFWGCMVVTDPVTITYRPFIGAIGGFVVGFVAMFFDGFFSAGTIALLILCLNVISYVVDNSNPSISKIKILKTRIKNPYLNIIKDSEHLKACLKDRSKVDYCTELTPKDILEKIEDSEVVGLGGAAFPTHLKIKSVIESNQKEKILIINAVECDPGLIHDAWILSQYIEEISKGIQLLSECIPLDKVILATKDISNLRFPDDVIINKVPNFYPIGAEKILIKNILGINLSNDAIPAQEGILVLNVQTIYSIYEAVYLNKKNVTKFITFANLLKKEAQTVKVELGSKVSEVVDTIYNGEGTVFVGGGLMNARQVNENELIEKSTNFIAVSEFPRYKESYCSKCGMCVKRCPSGLEVYKIASYVDNGQLEKTTKYNPEQCISCGICSYYCLAGKNLLRKVKTAQHYKKYGMRMG